MAGSRFSKGDKIRVTEKNGSVTTGTALQDRDFIGWAWFQVDTTQPGSEWVRVDDFNLNDVKVEVL
jgi:N-acetylneuraminic acid mutarotase